MNKSNKCRVSGEQLTEVINFGLQPLGNGFIKKPISDDEYFYPMAVGFNEKSMLLQLIEQPDPGKMFHDNYAFYSSTSAHMAKHFKVFADEVLDSEYISKMNPFVVELGCNDGILLRHFASKGLHHLGIEPSKNVALEANKIGVKTISEFFTESLAESIVKEHGQADIFMAANVMCHTPDICDIARGIKKILKKTGVAIFEDPYLGDIVKKVSYDQIYDEHVFLFSALSVKYLFEIYGLDLIDVLPQKTHGGSMRYVIGNAGVYPRKSSVDLLIQEELRNGLHKTSTYIELDAKIRKSRDDFINLLIKLKNDGKSVAGYGATSKSTTILNYCGIDSSMLSYICDTTPIKQGKLTPGTHIPVMPYEHFLRNPPDYSVLFAWNHSEEIFEKEKKYTESGGRWILHVPTVRVV
jgi:2-polyprenyl-3-methyl-5-hydroxy-6-metoxy-1,4-benzoquinol methylase